MEITIDERSGFCFGVKKTIHLAESELREGEILYCLGEMVHNHREVERLEAKGIVMIDREKYFTLSNCRVIVRAHGEPPETYQYAKDNNIELLDGTCPVVIQLQKRVHEAQEDVGDEGSVVIYGKKNHPEVLGLMGQTDNKAVIIESIDEVENLDFAKPIKLFSQTTMDRGSYNKVHEAINQKIKENDSEQDSAVMRNSICGQVANRIPWLKQFSQKYDSIVFVGGKRSSNSKVLYGHCKNVNPNSYFVTEETEVKDLPLNGAKSVGICGATSTPRWLMENVANSIKDHFSS